MNARNSTGKGAALLAVILIVGVLLAGCGKAATPKATLPVQAVTKAPPTATRPPAHSPTPAPPPTATLTPAPPTPTFTPAPTATNTPVPPLLDRLPTGSNQEFTLTLTDQDLSELIALGTKDSVDPEIFWPEAKIHKDYILVTARMVATARALVIEAEVRGNLILQSGIPRFRMSDLKTYILCYFCFDVVNGEPRLRITPGPRSTAAMEIAPEEYGQLGGGADPYAMAEGMVNNALWYVDPARPAKVSLGGFVITEFKQEEGLLTLKGRTK